MLRYSLADEAESSTEIVVLSQNCRREVSLTAVLCGCGLVRQTCWLTLDKTTLLSATSDA